MRITQSEEVVRHHVGQAEIMIGMKMGEEDGFDVFGLDSSPQHPAHGADAAANQVRTPVYDEQRRRLRAIEARGRPASRAKKENLRAL